jgi:hypothetical protein
MHYRGRRCDYREILHHEINTRAIAVGGIHLLAGCATSAAVRAQVTNPYSPRYGHPYRHGPVPTRTAHAKMQIWWTSYQVTQAFAPGTGNQTVRPEEAGRRPRKRAFRYTQKLTLASGRRQPRSWHSTAWVYCENLIDRIPGIGNSRAGSRRRHHRILKENHWAAAARK